MLQKIVEKKLQKYVKMYFAAHPEVKLIAVAGSVGKTSTMSAIATVLSQQFAVRMHDNPNKEALSVPLSILGIKPPAHPKNPFAWLGVFRAARLRIKRQPEAQIIIQELDANAPGDMQVFAQYLHPNIAVVTSVTPEHMMAFQSVEAVAAEQLSIGTFSQQIIINRYDVSGEYAQYVTNPNLLTYGSSELAEYSLDIANIAENGHLIAELRAPGISEPLSVNTQVIGEHKLRNLAVAAAIGLQYGMAQQTIVAALEQIKPVPGRLNPLPGIDGTIILDDSNSASPAAMVAALQTLYLYEDRPQRVAVLGSMDNLGSVSQAQHEAIGAICNPNLLSWVITVGDEANQYLAPAARQKGNQVKTCNNAIEAAEFTRSITETGAAILVKGARDGLYLEETVKLLCDLTQHGELVRQTDEWMAYKQTFFETTQPYK